MNQTRIFGTEYHNQEFQKRLARRKQRGEIQSDYASLKVGRNILDDASINIDFLSQATAKRDMDKDKFSHLLQVGNVAQLIDISMMYYRHNSVYRSLVNYLANLMRFDWVVMPKIPVSKRNAKMESRHSKILEAMDMGLNFYDNMSIKALLPRITLDCVLKGSYYGYLIEHDESVVFQDLDVLYCRSRFYTNGLPSVEFNMRYFDDKFADKAQRERVLKSMPPIFLKGYRAYKAGRLKPDFMGDTNSWYLLDDNAVHFYLSSDKLPFFIALVPDLLDLDQAKELNLKKMIQQLMKIIVQKFPLNKNGDLVLDPQEIQDFHSLAVRMLGNAVGVDVLTTFADVESIDLSDRISSNSANDLEKVKEGLYNSAGISSNLFNANGNLALDKSTRVNMASINPLIQMYQNTFNFIGKKFIPTKKVKLNFEILPTTVFNFEDMSRFYKEQGAVGFSIVYAQVALGISQRMVMSSIAFENEILKLKEQMIPPLNSNTMSSSPSSRNANLPSENSEGGRPSLPVGQKSTKTIVNIEAQE